MAVTGGATVSRAVSRDGTEIAYWTSGQGPPLVLVHGVGTDHTRPGALRPYLEPHVTVHAVDRRGRGASGDRSDYALEREFEDVAAVVDAIAEASESTVDVYGHAHGGIYAFGAATLTSSLRKLVLYEGWPSVNPRAILPPAGLVERMEALLAGGDREAVIETLGREIGGMTDEKVDACRDEPSWRASVAVAHTIPRENRALVEAVFDPPQAASITAPTLLLVGQADSAWKREVETVAAALPDARIAVLDEQGHSADAHAPDVVAEAVLAFLRERP